MAGEGDDKAGLYLGINPGVIYPPAKILRGILSIFSAREFPPTPLGPGLRRSRVEAGMAHCSMRGGHVALQHGGTVCTMLVQA